MRRLTQFAVLLLVAMTCVGCDQLTKDFARDHLLYGTRMTIIEDLVHLVYTENAGIAFGIGSGLPDSVRFWLFGVGIVVVLLAIGVITFLRRGRGPLFLSGAVLVMAGGISNLIDRLLNDGHVVDFVVLNVGSLRTIIFNFADVLVLCGSALLILSALRSQRGTAAPRAA